MSGGVDSSVAAYLLKKQGYQCIGVFMQFWHDPALKKTAGIWENQCCSQESLERARRVAQILKMPFYVYDCQETFKKAVVDYFIKGYTQGLTPNPCIECNYRIKFGLLQKKARQLNADFLATGHYARLRKKNGQLELLKALDRQKDQSYFLYTLGQKDLKFLKFPVGHWYKKNILQLAKKLELPNPRRESQDICFIPPKGLAPFLKRHLPANAFKKGPIQTVDGKTVGQHTGLTKYTIGQRQGLEVGGLNEPHYVIQKDFSRNLLRIGAQKALYQKELTLQQINFIAGKPPHKTSRSAIPLKAAVRYRDKPTPALLELSPDQKPGRLTFIKPKRAITPGQSVVFYDGVRILGGGVIS